MKTQLKRVIVKHLLNVTSFCYSNCLVNSHLNDINAM